MRKFLIALLTAVVANPIYIQAAHGAEVVVSHYLGSGGMGTTDGASNIAQFQRPSDVVVDSSGNAYVLVTKGVRKIDTNNRVTTLFTPTGTGTTTDYCGIAIDKDSNIWFADCQRTTLFKVSNSGNLLNTINLQSAQSSWSSPMPGLDVLPDGSVLVVIQMAGKILKVSPSGAVSTYFQNSAAGACNVSPRPTGFVCPVGITTSPSGEVFIANFSQNGYEVLKINSDQTTTKVASPLNVTVIDYSNGALYFAVPTNTPQKSWQLYKSVNGSNPEMIHSRIELNPWSWNGFDFIDGNTFIVTSSDSQVVRKINISNNSQTIIGNAKFGSEDGDLSKASAQFPSSITEDAQGNIYFIDLNGIRRISKQGQVTTLYRTSSNLMGLSYYNQKLYFLDNSNLNSMDLNGNVQQITNVSITGDYPVGLGNCLVVDRQGKIYVVMYRNGDYSNKYIRKYDQSGSFKNLPISFTNNSDVKIAVDQNDLLVVAASGQIKKYPDENSSTGTTVGSYFGWSQNIAVSPSGAIYVYSRNENTTVLNVIQTNGSVENIINGTTESSVNAGAKSGFGYVYGMLAATNGDVYLSDANNNSIRLVKVSTTSSNQGSNSNSNSSSTVNLRKPRDNSTWSRPSGLLAGLSEVRYKGYFKDNPQFFNNTTERTLISKTNSKQLPIWYDSTEMGTDMSIYWGGYFIPDQSGTWDFQITSDDASFLWIGNDAVSKYWYGVSSALIGLPGDHGPQTSSKSIRLEANKIYPFRIFYGNYGGPAGTFKLEIKPPAYKTSWDTNLEGLIWHSDFSDQEDCTNFGISYILSAKLGYDVIDVPACKNNPAKIFANGISSGTPVRPLFKGFNVVGNTLNLNVNIGEGANKPDKVYLIAPQLGINLRDANSAGQISGSTATWSIPLTSALLGKSLQLQFLSNKDGVDSDILVRSIAIPNNSKSTSKNSAAPLSAINPKYSISGAKILLSAKLQLKPNSNAISGYLISPENGLTYNNSILGKISANTISFIIPILPNMLGKKLKTEIYLVNEIGESKPLYVSIPVPAPKQPTVVIPTEKVKTVICKKGQQARTFAGTKCPPGWN